MNSFLSVLFLSIAQIHGTDPEMALTGPDIIRRWGYPVEVHHVTTEDGYILELHRIPHGKYKRRIGPPIFIQHGLVSCSIDWATSLPHQSAAYVFADAGFDVWLGNNRGNTYSKSHVRLSSDDSEFWDFSWDEMSKYDLPAMIDYVLNETRQESLEYMSLSQSGTIMLAKLADDPSFSRKIKHFFAMGPATSMENSQGSMIAVLRLFGIQNSIFGNFPFGTEESMGEPSTILNVLSSVVCQNVFGTNPCALAVAAASGPQVAAFNETRLPVILNNYPSGSSKRTVLHFYQMLSGEFRKFDYGSARNYRKYGQASAPRYDLTKINSSIVLFYGGNDYLVDKRDVENWLIPRIKGSLKKTFYIPTFNHADFLWGLDAAKLAYRRIIEIIQE